MVRVRFRDRDRDRSSSIGLGARVEALNGRGDPTSFRRRSLLQAGAALVFAHGCTPKLRKEAGAMRIVSTSPSMTESVFAIGRGDALVGRSSFCDYPPEAAKVEVIGGFSTPSLEKIVSLSPSLVCGERGPSWPDSVAEIERLGIATFFPPIDAVRDVPAAIRELGARVEASARAEEVAKGVEAKIEEVRARVADRPKLRVVMLFDWRPLVAAGSKSFPDEILSIAGGVNPITGGPYPKLSTEGLLSLDPDVVLDGSGGAYDESPEALVASIPGLSALRAASEGRVRRIPGSSALRPGPRIGEGVEVVAKLIHPEAFPS